MARVDKVTTQMKLALISRAFLGWLIVAFAFVVADANAQSKELKFEASLVWATNLETSPDPNHKPAGPDVMRKLKEELPLKWKNYFVVTNVPMLIVPNGSRDAVLSEKCSIRVADIRSRHVEVSIFGKGEPIFKRTMPLSVGELQTLLGGNAPGDTGWIVLIKRVE
jgi:hypothetical protein